MDIPKNIKQFNKNYKIVESSNIQPPKMEEINPASIATQSLAQYKKVQTQYRRNKIFHKLIRNSNVTYVVSVWTTWTWPLVMNWSEWNENKLEEIYDNGWKIRKNTLYWIYITIPFEIDDIAYLQFELEKTKIDWTTETLAYWNLESHSLWTAISDTIEESTLVMNFVWYLEKWDEIKLLPFATPITSYNWEILFGRNIWTMSLVSLSY